MEASLKAMCKQLVTRYAYVSSNRNNDYAWQTDVVDQHVTLTGTTAFILHTYVMTGVVVRSTDNITTYLLDSDYTINYTTGAIARKTGSTIPSGATVHVSYSWQTVTTFLARIEEENILIRNDLGQEMLSTCQIYCDNDVTIDTKDKITSTYFNVDYPEILKLERNPDENGELDHIVIYTK